MPIVRLEPLPLGAGIDRPEAEPVEEDRPSFKSLTEATFRRENMLASAAQAGQGIDTTPDPDFKPFDQIKGTPYEPHFNAFLDVQNRPQFDEVKRRIDQETEDRKTVDAAPLWMSLPASLMANVTDPSILAPAGAFVRGTKGGWSMLKSGAAVGTAAASGTAAQEAFLHGTQFTRTPEESAFSIGSSFVLGGLLGTGGSALLNKAEWKAHVNALDRELAGSSTQSIKDNPLTAPIYEDIAAQLRTSKPAWMGEDEIEKYAAVTAARYQARAERLGGDVSAHDLYKGEGIEVRGPGAPAAEGRAFDQGGAEKIQTAAIRVEDKVYTGASHGDAVVAAEDALGLKPNTLFAEGRPPVDNGFVTTTGRFVDRHEADKIARGDKADSGGLDSWDLPALHEQVGAERVVSAAVRMEGKIYTGAIHSDAYEAAIGRKLTADDGYLVPNLGDDSGFVTNTGRYVTREEAKAIALAADQVHPGRVAISGDRLLAEDLREDLRPLPAPHPDRSLGDALRAIDDLRAANRNLPDADRAILGELISGVRSAADKRQLSIEEGIVHQGDRFSRKPLAGGQGSKFDVSVTAPRDGSLTIQFRVNGGGALNAVIDGDVLKVRNIAVLPAELQRKGRGLALYEAAIDYAHDRGLSFASDTKLSPEAIAIWSKLERRGYDVTKNPNVEEATFPGKGLISKDQRTPDNPGMPIFEIRPPRSEPWSIVQHAWLEADNELRRAAAVIPKLEEVKARHPELAEQIDAAARAVQDVMGQRERSFNQGTEPPVPPDHVRLYRGETDLPKEKTAIPDWLKDDPNIKGMQDASGRWFVKDRAVAEYYNHTFGDKSGRVSYVDVPASKAEKYLSANQPAAKKFSAGGRTGEEYFVSREIADRRKPLSNSDNRFSQGSRGQITFQENKAIIDLFESADRSTFLHEMGHKWLEELAVDAARADVPQALKDDFATVLRWLKVEKVGDIKIAHHEQWAQAFERYLAEGKAPSSALAQAFESFKQWLTSIYKSLTSIDSTITDDIRGVMDRMLASDAEMKASRAYGPGSVGAAATSVPSLGQTAIAGKVAGGAAYATQRLNPGLRMAHSEVPEVRDIGMNLAEMSQYIRGNQDGLASPVAVETLRKEWNGGLMNAVRDTTAGYKDYRKGGGTLSRSGFREAVGQAMRRGDESDIPEVAKVAKSWRREVFDPLKEAAMEPGVELLPKDVQVDTAVSYFSRLWNRQKLIAQEGGFKQVVTDWVAANMPSWERAVAQSTERRLEPLRREISDIEMAKLHRGEERKLREDEIAAGDFSESDIRRALRIVQGGAPKPKGVKTLTQFVVDAGGVFDPGGDVRHMGINPKSRPGLLRNERKRFQSDGGGHGLDEMTQKAWEAGYFPDHVERPSSHDFLEALSDDFNKRRAVLRNGDRDAYKLQELIDQLDQDLARVGASPTEGPRFSTSEETKGIVDRVFKAMDAEADRRLGVLKGKLLERETDARLEHEARFGNQKDAGKGIADEVFNTLTGRTSEGVRPEFITIKARGPLKERTFNIPDELVERWLEDDVDLVGRRYSRIMSADVELARKFGSVDMADQIAKVHEGYDKLRADVTDEKQLLKIAKQEKADIRDIEGTRDIIRGTYAQSGWERDFGRIVRVSNNLQYILKMGQVVLSSLTEPVRVVAAKGLLPFMGDAFNALSHPSALKMSIEEARLAGNINDKILAHRLSTVADLTDFYGSRGPVEKFLDNATNVASSWNGIRMWTDGVKMLASTMIQNKVLRTVAEYGAANAPDKRYLNFLGINQGMADRIAKQFAEHGDTQGGVRIAGTEKWTDEVARRTYRAALNKDLDSMVVTRGAADLPLFANTPLGRMIFQFNTFNMASHQRILLRGLQEGHARFLSTVAALTGMGMLQTYLTAIATNSVNRLPDFETNKGWWISEGLDKSGVFMLPMQIANGLEKLTGINPIKSPIKAGDEGSAISQKNRNRNELGVLGPTAGTIQDIGTAVGIPKAMYQGQDVSKAQKNAVERLLPFNSYYGLRQILKYFVNAPTE